MIIIGNRKINKNKCTVFFSFQINVIIRISGDTGYNNCHIILYYFFLWNACATTGTRLVSTDDNGEGDSYKTTYP